MADPLPFDTRPQRADWQEGIPLAERWLTRKQVAELTGVSVATISRACTSGRLTHCKVNNGKLTRFRWAWVNEWIQSGMRPRAEDEAA